MKPVKLPIILSLFLGFNYGWICLILVVLGFVAWRYTYLKWELKNSVKVLNREVLKKSAIDLAEMIKNKEIKSTELVNIFISQIEASNSIINAVVADRFEEARKEAAMADKLLNDIDDVSKLPPLHGVPCTIKECFEVTGMPNSSGLHLRNNLVATKDATVVDRLKKAGAIVLGVTNLSELCMWMESANLVYGRTLNPYDTRMIVGGSSGGEGAILTSCGAAFGIGSDIGGSIRMPAFFNGIFGHKPSAGLVPNTGQFPLARSEAGRYLTTGPMCKRAKDLMPLLKIIAGPDGIDPSCVPFVIGDPNKIDLRKLKVISIRQGPKGLLHKKVSQDMQEAQKKVEKHFLDLGLSVEVIDYLPQFEKTFDMWSACLSEAKNDDFAYLMGNKKYYINSVVELLKWLIDIPSHTFPAIGLAILENLPKLTPERTKKLAAEAKQVRELIDNKLGDNGIILYPSYPEPAPRHNRPLVFPVNFVYTAIFNILYLPVTQVPLGLNNEGIPLGIQVVSRLGNDAETIAVALELEKAFGGWREPGQANKNKIL